MSLMLPAACLAERARRRRELGAGLLVAWQGSTALPTKRGAVTACCAQSCERSCSPSTAFSGEVMAEISLIWLYSRNQERQCIPKENLAGQGVKPLGYEPA